MIDYKKKLQKIKDASLRKERRLKKRIALLRGKPKKVSMKNLRMELRRITHKIVRMRASRCYTCDKPLQPKERQAGHFWSDGGHSNTRFDLENLRVQGSCCNLYKSGNLAEFSIRLQKELGQEKFAALAIRAHQPKKWNRTELEALIEERKKML